MGKLKDLYMGIEEEVRQVSTNQTYTQIMEQLRLVSHRHGLKFDEVLEIFHEINGPIFLQEEYYQNERTN